MLLQVKKYSEKLLLPLAKKIKRIPANIFTFLGLISALIAFLGFIFNQLFIIALTLFLVEFFDQLDGVVARLQGPTLFGSFLDSTLDRIGDFAIFIGVILGNYITLEIGLITLIGAFLTSYTRAKIESLEPKKLYGVGVLERTDRIPILFIGIVLEFWFKGAIWWTMVILAIGTSITTIQRIIYAHKKFSLKTSEHDDEEK
ncbi:MAG: CDP-alcohol phosphatidyltransferase family protein [Promethearchaeota archaeon]